MNFHIKTSRALAKVKAKLTYGNSFPMFQSLVALLIIFTLYGCGGKPWTNSLAEDASEDIKEHVHTLADREKKCRKTIEADLALFYSSPLQKRAFKGYFLFSPPKSYKFVMTNPLGQTAWAIAGNRNTYQILEPMRSRYTAGNLDSFGLRNNIPSFFLQGDWYSWLTGRLDSDSNQIIDLRNDSKNRGIWITTKPDILSGNSNHLLFDVENQMILERIITAKTGKKLANIQYNEIASTGHCSQPRIVTLSGLDFGVEIRMELENIALLDEVSNYQLPVPSGYFQKYLP